MQLFIFRCLLCRYYYFLIILALFSGQIYESRAQHNKLSNNQVQDVINELWHSDKDRVQLDLNYQVVTKSNSKDDRAPEKLFKQFNQQILSLPTVKKLINLFEFYDNAGSKQKIDEEKLQKLTDEFLNELLKSEELKILQRNLKQFGYEMAKDDDTFKKSLNRLWFSPYSRQRELSSGFRHIFVGEFNRRNEEVNGLHNWIRFEMLEKRGDIDYAGYMIIRPFVNLIHYKWKNYWKKSGSMFLGTSPEFDFSVYTFCYLAKPGKDKCVFSIGDCTNVTVSSFKLDRDGQQYIGTVYPSPKNELDSCPLKTFKSNKAESTIMMTLTHTLPNVVLLAGSIFRRFLA